MSKPGWKASIERKAAVLKQVFSSHSGKEALRILCDEFDADDLRGATVEETYYRLGQRDVVIYLKQLNRMVVDDEVVNEQSSSAAN